MKKLLYKLLLKPSAAAILNITQISPLFFDTFDTSAASLTGRTGWTVGGDATNAAKIKSSTNIARMTTNFNSGTRGFQLTPDPGAQNRRVKFGYNFSQNGGTLTDTNSPYQLHDQIWIVAWTDPSNYTYINWSTGSPPQLRMYKVIATVATEIFRWLNMPTIASIMVEMTDRVRLYADNNDGIYVLRIPDMLYTDSRNVWPDRLFPSGTDAVRTGPAALRDTFYGLCLSTEVGIDTMDVTVNNLLPFYGRDATNKRTITFGGTYTGTPVSWAYRLRRRTTNAVVKDWTAFSPTFGSGTWSAPLDIASGGPYVADFGWTGGDGFTRVGASKPFAVGILICAWGQSNAANLSGVTGTPGYGGNDLILGFNGYLSYIGYPVRTWVDELTPESRTYNPNMVGLAKSLSDATGIPVGVAATGQTAQDITTLKPGATYWNSVLVPFVTEIGGNVEHWLWSQGEAEALALSNQATYPADYALLVAGLRTLGGRSTAMIFNRIIGRDTSATTNSTTIARSYSGRSMLNALENGTDIWTACSSLGLPLSDTVHFTSASSVEWSRRAGMTIARRAYGALAYDGRGPMITGASRVGAVITLAITLNGAASISGSALVGYEVTNDDFVTSLTINSTEVSANTIVITLAATPSGTIKVRSYAGPAYTETSIATGSYTAEGITIPVFPILDALTCT